MQQRYYPGATDSGDRDSFRCPESCLELYKRVTLAYHCCAMLGPSMKCVLSFLFFLSISLFLCSKAAIPQTRLPNGKVTEAVPGSPQPTNNWPTAIAVSPDQTYAVLLHSGYGAYSSGRRQSLSVLNLRTNELTDFPDNRLGPEAPQTYFLGLAFSSDGKWLYASMASLSDPLGKKAGNTGNGIAVYRFDEGQVTPQRFLEIPPRRRIPPGKIRRSEFQNVTFPAGLSVGTSGGEERILTANNYSDEAVLLDAKDGRVIHRFDLSLYRHIPGSLPYTTVMSSDGRTGYVSLWNGSTVAQLDLAEGRVTKKIALRKPRSDIEPGSHPTAMVLSHDNTRLYVALANADDVAAVDCGTGRVIAHLSTKLPEQRYGGSDPNALGISVDEQRLYTANAISDSVAVFDLTKLQANAKQSPVGFIPTEWYPTALGATRDELLIASAKGKGSGPITELRKGYAGPYPKYEYIPALTQGSIARVPLRELDSQLAGYTNQVVAANAARGNTDHIPFASGTNPIKHVIYIIKENRTFDQVLGDLGAGNGDRSLTMYGEEVTPNEHQLARQFGVLDNFYDSGDVSGDGHIWSTAATVSDYVAKNWPIGYRGKERTYDSEGQLLHEIPLEEGIPDVGEPQTGFLWRNFARHGISYRHYGEFIVSRWCHRETEESAGGPPQLEGRSCLRSVIEKGQPLEPNVGHPHGSPSPYPWPIPVLAYNTAAKVELRGHFDPRFPDFQLEFPDQLRVDEFLNEFNAFVNSRQGGNDTMPQFILLRLPNDHTAGGRKGMPTPSAYIADNDLAVGRVAEAISHSAYWDDTAIMILEDDAQDGPDHVDGHRSIAFVISKYSPPRKTATGLTPFVDHTFYTTINMVRTIEALLGAPPMNVNDARAALMAPLFAGDGSQAPFRADYRNRDNGLLYKTNPQEWKEGANLDFSRADAADPVVLNRFLWKERMGAIPMPKTQHRVFPQPDVH